MVRSFSILVLAALPVCAQTPLRGYPQDQWKPEHQLEEKALAIPSPPRLKIYMERVAEQPHHAGSAGAKAVADYALGEMKEWSLDAHIENFEALLPYPTVRIVEMTAPTKFRAQLREPAIAADKDTGEAGQLPSFNAYSASGDVTGPLVYANFGMPEDYEYLRRQGIDIRGKIVIVRYGHGWRGIKPKLAQDGGAIGCLIYSDPHEDGYFQGDAYPRGQMRPEQGVQRGSVLDMQIYPGDPLSPGWASEQGSKRLPRSQARTILKIPVMPLSYGDARPLLEALGGAIAPETWRGALPFTYHLGPGPATVRVKLDFDWTSKPLRDVIAVIPGTVYKDQWVIYGNHHDAWVNGANDPASGVAVLLETARTLSLLRKQGWQPKRTIVLALWDGEEFGLTGSTEWVEKHEQELEQKGAIYINSDANGRGTLTAGGSGTLETFVREVLRDMPEPAGGSRRQDLRLYPLGAGSDYVPFLDHAGIASLNLGFGSAETGGIYHSIYDTMAWYERFSDTDGAYGRSLAQVMSTMLIRLADAPVLPYQFHDLARSLRGYLNELPGASTLDVHEARSQVARLYAASRMYDEALASAMRRGSVPPEKLIRLNETLAHAERALLLPDGLPGREWYRHQIYAPGMTTGYGAKTLPGVREAVDAQHWEEANQQARRLAQVLKSMTARVEEATKLLTP